VSWCNAFSSARRRSWRCEYQIVPPASMMASSTKTTMTAAMAPSSLPPPPPELEPEPLVLLPGRCWNCGADVEGSGVVEEEDDIKEDVDDDCEVAVGVEVEDEAEDEE